MKLQSEFNYTLHWFCKEIGVTFSLLMDVHMTQNNNMTNKSYHQVWTTLHILEAVTPWANRERLFIGLFKEAVRRYQHMKNAPMVLCDYCMERQVRIHNSVPRPLFQNQEMTPHESTFGKKGNIYNICNFGWYQLVYYITPGSFPDAK